MRRGVGEGSGKGGNGVGTADRKSGMLIFGFGVQIESYTTKATNQFHCSDWVSCWDSGCTFEEDPDVSLCEYRQGQEDDFDWQLVRTTSWPYVPSDLTRGESRNELLSLFTPVSHNAPLCD
ncbi:hypothetical protein AOLI_G00322080 [Acnodon oligacanthus]